ncbi:hypothetical protein [Sphingobium limneticum]|uniref:Uncharacterized protein n=1 Tax=Sphingobium limneticum TaxID=1007511 RepID=A0A5J5I665_9SPHN|nr:hypothetical protein [Sphingobium limneticum]KAA9018305.1 hypothetical protein F4U96_09340 [Sphingobium limneticum]KAA9030940.1 hypothetical protein F4U95_09285 [Sphingobium limneticum]
MIDKGALFVLPKSVSIAPSSTGSATSASNLLHDERALVWRSTGLTGTYLIVTQTGAWDTIALVGTNLRPTDTIRIRAAANATAVTTSPALDQTIVAYSGVAKATGSMVIFRLPVAVSHAVVRIDIVSTDNPAGFVQVSNLILGTAVEWDGIDTGAEVSYDNQGQSYLRKFLTKPTWKINLSGMDTTSYYNVWEDFCLAASDRRGFLFVPIYNDPHMQKRSAFVSMVGSPKLTFITGDIYSLELTVTTIQ